MHPNGGWEWGFLNHQQYPSPQDPLENSQQLEAFRGGILREQFVKVLARLAPGHIRNEFPKPQWVLKSGKPHNTTITKHKQQVLRLKVLLFWQGASKNRSKLIVTKAFCFFPESLLQGLVVQACRKSNCPEYNEANQTNSSHHCLHTLHPTKKIQNLHATGTSGRTWKSSLSGYMFIFWGCMKPATAGNLT